MNRTQAQLAGSGPALESPSGTLPESGTSLPGRELIEVSGNSAAVALGTSRLRSVRRAGTSGAPARPVAGGSGTASAGGVAGYRIVAGNPTTATRTHGAGARPRGNGLGLFVKRWASDPRRIGAILPSAKPLARIMARASMEARSGIGPVVELGPGTGSITRALLESELAGAGLVLIERDRELCRLLEHRFPEAEVIEGEAARIGAILDERAAGVPSVVVSSLPLRNMTEAERDTILRAILDVLPPAGALVQFTYVGHPGIACPRLGVACRRVGFTALNFPPASVWRIGRA